MPMWTVHLEGGPRRVNHAAVSIGSFVFSFGGYCSGDDYAVTRPMDIHRLNTESLFWAALPLPAADSAEYECVPYQRYGHTAVAYEDCVYVWGGRNDCNGACNILYCFNTSLCAWSKPSVTGGIPGARDGHSACVVINSMYIFGGYEEQVDMFSNQVHALNLLTMNWTLVNVNGTPPKWRDFHTAIGVGKEMYIFGGRMDRSGPYHTGNEFYCNKLQVLDTQTNTWHQPKTSGQIPYGRRSHSIWTYNNSLYIFGGYNSHYDVHFNDMYKYDLATNAWSLVKAVGNQPSRRRRQCCCLVGNKVFLFGGTSPSPTPKANRDNTTDNMDTNLLDNSDLHVLDYTPSLRTLCCVKVIDQKLPLHDLPLNIRQDIAAMTTNGNISRPLTSSG